MIESTEPSNTPEQVKSHKVHLLTENLRRFDSLASSVQREISDAFKRDPGTRERLARFAALPGNKSLDSLHRSTVAFVNAMAFAEAVNINLLTSVLAHHSSITGKPIIQRLTGVINQENVTKRAENAYADESRHALSSPENTPSSPNIQKTDPATYCSMLGTLSRGTPVRVSGENQVCFILSPAAWGGASNTTATHYNLRKAQGGFLDRVAVRNIVMLSPQESGEAEVRDAEIRAQKERKRFEKPNFSPLDLIRARMLQDPSGTIQLAARLLGKRKEECADLAAIIELLILRYRKTHCWSCGTDLDNLTDPNCPKCGGLKCGCGGCRCNWRYAPASQRATPLFPLAES